MDIVLGFVICLLVSSASRPRPPRLVQHLNVLPRFKSSCAYIYIYIYVYIQIYVYAALTLDSTLIRIK